jgi:uncharacterized membrane protein SpoIIM required for sporulation
MAPPLARFVAERKPRWAELSALIDRLARGHLSLEEVESLDRHYRRASADLAFARVHYANTEAFVYLNGLVTRAYGSVYATRPSRWGALKRFYASEFPAAFYQERRFFAAAWALLLTGAWLGVAVALYHPEAIPALVPLGLREHIAEGRMWTDSLLEVVPPALLSAQILTNNIGVAFTTFIGGLPLGLGTLVTLLVNGLNLGAVTALCIRRGMGADFFSFVLAHGLVELTAVALAGQAGLVMASGWIAPGQYSRVDALRERGGVGVRIVLGAAPLLFGIGMVEGFVSPGDLFPGAVRAGLGVTLAGLLYGYLFRYGRAATRTNL